MDVAEFARLHDVLAKYFKEYEQEVGCLRPVEVLNELRYALRASIELLNLQAGPQSDKERNSRPGSTTHCCVPITIWLMGWLYPYRGCWTNCV